MHSPSPDPTQRYAFTLQLADEPTALPRILLLLSRRRITPEYLEHRRGPGRTHSLVAFEIFAAPKVAATIARQLERTEETNVVEYCAAQSSERWLAHAS